MAANKAVKKNSGSTLRVLVIMAGITLIALFFAWTRVQNTNLRLKSSKLKQREQEALAENNRLKLEWARLVSPKRLEDLGKEKYNLSRPRPEQVIVLTEP